MRLEQLDIDALLEMRNVLAKAKSEGDAKVTVGSFQTANGSDIKMRADRSAMLAEIDSAISLKAGDAK